MIINSIIRFFKNEKTYVKPILGRWNTNNHRESMIKNKYATEDNCYISCNNYQNRLKNNNNDNNDTYIFMMEYESSI